MFLRDQLERVMNWYNAAMESQRIAVSLLQYDPELLDSNEIFGKSIFAAMSLEEAMEIARTELDDLAILSMVSLFEQTVIQYLIKTSSQMTSSFKDPFKSEILSYAFSRVDRWPFVEILRLFKPTMGGPIVSEVLQVYSFRNWVAHGKQKDIEQVKLSPKTAYNRLAAFLAFLDQLP